LDIITVFDVETPNKKNDRICAIGITLIEKDAITVLASQLVNPECAFDQGNTLIHGIRPEDVADSPTFPEVWRQVSPLFTDSIVVGHNVIFDLTVLRKTLAHYGIELPPIRYMDTCRMARACYPELPNFRLDTICDFLRLDLDHHDPSSDAEATARILVDMFSRVTFSNPVSVYDRKAHEQKQSAHRQPSRTTTELRELGKLLSDCFQDGVVKDEDCREIYIWMRDHSELAGNYPFDDIFVMLSSILEDGTVSEDEEEALLSLLRETEDPVSNACSCCPVDVNGLAVVLTGAFIRGERAAVAAELSAQGAVIKNDVSKKTGLVLVGSLGSENWVSGNYGSKIKKALELQAAGHPIVIMREEDYFC